MADYKSEEKSVDELVELLGIHKSQLNLWLKRAVSEKTVDKLSSPVRYRWAREE